MDATSDAESLQSLHRVGTIAGERVERICRESELVDRDAAHFESESAEPSHGGSLVSIRVPIAEHQTDPQRVVERDLWKLASGG